MEGYLVDGAENPADRTSWEKGNLKSHEFYKVNCTIPKWWLALKVEISQPSNSIKVYWPRFGATIWRGFAWTRPKLDSISLGVKIQKMFLKSPTNTKNTKLGACFLYQNLIVFTEFQAFISQNFVSIGFVLFPIIQKMVDHES